jgi:hypothetical protein
VWLEKVNEQLIEGREDIYFGFEFEHRTVKKLRQYALGHYIEHFAASREALRGSFEFYRAIDATTALTTFLAPYREQRGSPYDE